MASHDMQLMTHCVYVMSTNGCIKVGVAKDDPESRLNGIQTGIPWNLTLEAAWDVPSGTEFRIERRAHRLLAPHRMRGEWFRCGMEEVAKHEADLFRMAFGAGAFPDAPSDDASAADRYVHGIMSQGRWMTLAERQTYRHMLGMEILPAVKRKVDEARSLALVNDSEEARLARREESLRRMFPSLFTG